MFLKTKDNRFYHVESYGARSWGSFSQIGIEKSRNGKWYISYSDCQNPYEDLWEKYKIYLDVVEELDKLPDGVMIENQKDYECFMEMMRD